MLNTTYSSIPSEEQYLHAKKHLIKKWKNKIGSKGFKVGIAWKGSNSDADRYRSFSVKEFEILSSLKDIRFISLQKNDGVEQLKDNLKINIEDYSHEIDTGDQAFTDTSAIIDNLDLNELAQLNENQFKKLFRKSPIKRIGRNRFVRNILYAIGNSGDIKFKKTL